MERFSIRKWLLALLVPALCLCLAADVYARRSVARDTSDAARLEQSPCEWGSFEVTSGGGATEAIRCLQDSNGDCYVYLPAYADMASVRAVVPKGQALTLGGVPLEDGMSCAAFPTNTELEFRSGRGAIGTLTFLPSANVAALFVDTLGESMSAVDGNKERKYPASLALYNADGTCDYRSERLDDIRGRGQWSWQQDKKSYNLYLEDDAGLLGMAPASKWALIANVMDESNLRNWLAYTCARQLGGDSPFFAPDCAFADVYLDGRYNGLYLLCEKIEARPGRLDIDPASLLIDIDYASRIGGMKDPFLLGGGMAVEIKSPSPCEAARKDELKGRLRDFQAALLSEDGVSPATGRAWSDYIDLDSFARKYLIEEIFENSDAGTASQYFYWNAADGRLYAGPCWDYDNSLGIGWHRTPNCFLARRERRQASVYTPWFSALWRQEAFRRRVVELYKSEFLPRVSAMLDGEIAEKAREIETASRLNSLRWKSYYEANMYHQPLSYDGSPEAMTRFLREHIEFLSSAWLEGVEYGTVSFVGFSPYQFFCLPLGESCETIPTPQDFCLPEGMIWLDEDGAPFDRQSLLTGDIALRPGKAPGPK